MSYSFSGLHLVISDNGTGIPTEQITYCMTGGSLKHVGSGMGLSGAVQFMKNIGGKLTLNSKLGRGTDVRLEFPQDCILPPRRLRMG